MRVLLFLVVPFLAVLPAPGAAQPRVPPADSSLTEALRVAQPDMVSAAIVDGHLSLLDGDGFASRVPLRAVTLTTDHAERQLSMECHESLCIRGTGSFADGVRWTFPVDGPRGGEARAAYRRVEAALRAVVPPAAVRVDTSAAPPAPELLALAALPPERWTPLQPADSVQVDVVADPGNPPGVWMRVRFPSPRMRGGQPYDTYYADFVVECAAGRTRISRMGFTLEDAFVGDPVVHREPYADQPGTTGYRMLQHACAAAEAAAAAAPGDCGPRGAALPPPVHGHAYADRGR